YQLRPKDLVQLSENRKVRSCGVHKIFTGEFQNRLCSGDEPIFRQCSFPGLALSLNGGLQLGCRCCLKFALRTLCFGGCPECSEVQLIKSEAVTEPHTF